MRCGLGGWEGGGRRESVGRQVIDEDDVRALVLFALLGGMGEPEDVKGRIGS